MALNRQDKQASVAEVSEVAKGALSAVVADSRGVTVDKMTELRKACLLYTSFHRKRSADSGSNHRLR